MSHKLIKFSISMLVAAGFLFFQLQNVGINAAMPPPADSQSSFESWLLRTGRPVFSRYRSLRANYVIYRDYKLLTYGRPQDVPGIRYDSRTKQYSAHGFSYDEFTVTNTYFPEDSSVISNPSNWKNIELGRDAEISWFRLSVREKQYIKSAQILYMGRSFGEMTFSSLKLTEAKCVVIAVPSWYMGFALYTSHYNSRGELRYGTLHGNGIGSASLNCSLADAVNPSNKIYHIPYNKDHIDISLKVQSNLSGFTGLATAGDIAAGGVILGKKAAEAPGKGPWVLTSTTRYYQTSTDRSISKTRKVTEKATAWAVTIMGDLIKKETSFTFTIIEDAKPQAAPTACPTVSPVPQKNADGVLTIRGDIGFFRDGESLTGYPIPKNEKRFLCLEHITARLDFSGGELPQKAVFYPPGGKVTEVSVVKTGIGSGYASFSYYLDVMPSTVTWMNVRISAPLTCRASALFNNGWSDYFVGGIDITGSIYDIIYIQARPAG